ncbi:MAG: DUF3592 domain-containing protein [Oscillospiraceae bacterium]|nr:DUF3592 domain-containing protein [Oscillospiraceae bacterium]MCL2277914.1 DUF3592 domain-containing protein [Oscillospiraceae bacterium]
MNSMGILLLLLLIATLRGVSLLIGIVGTFGLLFYLLGMTLLFIGDDLKRKVSGFVLFVIGIIFFVIALRSTATVIDVEPVTNLFGITITYRIVAKVFVLVPIAIGIIFLLFGIMEINDARNNDAALQKFMERTSRTTATVIDVEPVTNFFGGTIAYRIVAEAEINGTRHVIRSSRPFFDNNPIHEFPIGSTVPVLFDPLDPSNNRFDMDEFTRARTSS